jgi:four helix bundle protein
MLKGFKTYELAVQLYRDCEELPAKPHMRDQLSRASLSIVLNIAEGAGKPSMRERRRFYGIALGSLRETYALLDLMREIKLAARAHELGGIVVRAV